MDNGNVFGISFAANAGFAAIIAGLPATAVTLRADYRFGTAEFGASLGLLGLGVALTAIPWVMLTDSWGDRRVLTIGSAGTAAALVAMTLFVVPVPTHAPDFGLFACSLLVVGLLSGCVNGTSGRAATAPFHDDKRCFGVRIGEIAAPAGAGLGALVLPILAMRFGFASVYGGLALLYGSIAALAWRWLQEPTRTVPCAPSGAATKSGMHPRLGHGVLRLASAIGLLHAPQVAVLSFATVFLHDFSHLDVATIGPILAAMQTGAAVARVASCHWTNRHGNRRDYLLGCSLTSAGLFTLLAVMVWNAMGTAAAPNTTSFAIPFVLMAAGICVSAWHGVACAELATLAGAARFGTALGLANTCVFAVFFVVPLGIPALLAWQSWPAVWMAAGSCAVVAMLLFDKRTRFDQDVWG